MTESPTTPLTPPHSGIVSVRELRAYMANVTFSANQAYIAALTLAGVQQELETYLSRPLEPIQVRETLVADNAGYLNTSVSPIHKVIKIENINRDARGMIFDLSSPYIPEVAERDPLIGTNGKLLDRLYPVVGEPLIVPGGIHAGLYSEGYTWAVEYVAGYNGHIDSGLKLDILRVAAREMSVNHDDTISLRQGDAERAAEGDQRGKGWTDEELAGWDRLRRRIVA